VKIGDRVRFTGGTFGALLGTIENVTPAVRRIRFDDGLVGRFSPARAARDLEIVTGDDALPRHAWRSPLVDVEICDTCGVIQTDANENEPCPVAQQTLPQIATAYASRRAPRLAEFNK
jgi:hypothetical protein